MSGGMDDLAELVSDLVRIDSVNPSLVPGGAGEAEIAAFVSGWAADCGLAVSTVGSAERPSVVVRAPGRGGGRTLLLCGHLDTVGVGAMFEPFDARTDGDRLFGRGAFDMKAGVAAALIACRAASEAALAGDVVVACVADEEHSSLGVQEVLEAGLTADGAIVTEPTLGEVIVAHKGFVWSEVTFRGHAAHGSRAEEGVDAIVKAGPVLVRLGALDTTLGVVLHPLLGRGSVHAGTIAGGAELSTYPGECVLTIERRTLPGETAEAVEAEITGLLAGTDAVARTTLVREPFSVDPEADIVRLVCSASGGAKAGAPYWTDAAFLGAAGIPTVLYGPSGQGAHADEEWVSPASVEAVARTLIDVASEFCA